MKITILLIWLHYSTQGGGWSAVFTSPQLCQSALVAAKREDEQIRGVCVPQGGQ